MYVSEAHLTLFVPVRINNVSPVVIVALSVAILTSVKTFYIRKRHSKDGITLDVGALVQRSYHCICFELRR